MPQHRRITLREVEDALEAMRDNDHLMEADEVGDLLRTLVLVDQMLVRHDKTPLARQLRQAFFRYTGRF